MSKIPIISIIIPIYNVEPYIADCLQSVMRQTYQGPLECILVDDCGTDRSMEVAEKLIADYNGSIGFRVLHHEQNRGLSAARNTGMTASQGDYFYFLDSDDWISDDCIEKLAHPLMLEKFDIVVGDFTVVGSLPYELELSLPEGPYHEDGITRTFCYEGAYVMAWNKLYCKEFLLKNRLIYEEGKIHEDEILVFDLCCIDKFFYVVKSVTYFYRIRENSIVTNKDQHKKLAGYVGVLQSIKLKTKQFENKEGIFDFYMFFLTRVFVWISRLDMDEELLRAADEQTKGFLDVIPKMSCLKTRYYRLVYLLCKKKQVYSHWCFVIDKIQRNKLRRVLKKSKLTLKKVYWVYGRFMKQQFDV